MFKSSRYEQKPVFTGPVRFVLKGKVEMGRIFGSPFYKSGASLFVNQYMYHIQKGDYVFDVPDHMIETIKMGKDS